ncbi:hypothetical protein J2T12_005474 [Paenibacillus anaericanus]|nr:hypothetical protein [Paenibacillus anaericanus]
MKSIEYNYKILIAYYLSLLFLWTLKESIFVNLCNIVRVN